MPWFVDRRKLAIAIIPLGTVEVEILGLIGDEFNVSMPASERGAT